MKALITGGAGFIGSALTRHLVGKLGWSAVVLDKLTYAGRLSSLEPVAQSYGFRFVQADICDRAAIDAVLAAHQPDLVFHLAAESHVDRSIVNSGAFIQTNLIGTFTMLEACRAYWSELEASRRDRFRFLHISTDEVFGSLSASGFFTEETPYDPRSPYSASKAGSDHLVQAWWHTYGFPALISNCSNNYGPYQLPEKLIPLTILNAMEGKALPVYGKGDNVRDWLYVDDHVEALCLIIEKGVLGRTYNVGGRNERTNLEVVGRICDILNAHNPAGADHNRLIEFVTDRPGHDHRYAIDATRLEHELGWKAKETFETGLARTIAWYADNATWWAPIRAEGVGAERIGLVPGKA